MSMHFLPTVASIAALAAVLASGCATPEPPKATPTATPAPVAVGLAAPGKSAPIEVVSAQFGVFGADPTGRRVLYETAKFPAVVAAPYGWYIIFKTEKPTVIWREEFELPEPPPTWGPGEAMGIYTISPDRKTAVTERIIPTRLGFIANEWRYAPGGPLQGWAYTEDDIRLSVEYAARSGRKVAGLILTSPDNPTGHTLSVDEQVRLARTACTTPSAISPTVAGWAMSWLRAATASQTPTALRSIR